MQHPGKSLPEFQEFHKWLDAEKGFQTADIRRIGLGLTTEVGELAKEILWYAHRLETLGAAHPDVEETRRKLGAELADCMAYLLKIANCAGLDLQEAYTEKMLININRSWRK